MEHNVENAPGGGRQNSLPIVQELEYVSPIYAHTRVDLHGVTNACNSGKIPHCHGYANGDAKESGPGNGCIYRCCKIDPAGAGNSIYLFADERADGLNERHLQYLEPYGAVRRADCIGRCNPEAGDFKPADCRYYPHLPWLAEGDIIKFKTGIRAKCPMDNVIRLLHLAYVLKDMWQSLQREWDGNLHVLKVAHLAMVQYEDFDITPLGQLTLDSLTQMVKVENVRLLQREEMRINLEIPPEKRQERLGALARYRVDLEKVTLSRLKICERIFHAKVDFTKNGISLDELQRCFTS
ncbi:MAG: hypothetical protein WC840_03125 [Candidatus Peribacteraceae bacterium]